MRAHALSLVATGGLAVLLLTSCAGGTGTGSGGPKAGPASTESAQLVGGVQTLDVGGSSANVFDTTLLYARPGVLRVRFHVVGGTPHDLQVLGVSGAETAVISDGQTAATTFTAPPGTYRFLCTIHPETMRGTLVVGTATPAPSRSAG